MLLGIAMYSAGIFCGMTDASAMINRREFSAAAASLMAAPAIVRGQQPLSLSFRTIQDPDGWHPSLRLRGDWLIFEISDGVLSGYGEASHSRDDEACRAAAAAIFERYYAGFRLSFDSLRRIEGEIAELDPGFVEATAFSGLNQALYDLLARKEQVPVWRLFADRTDVESVPLYTTINRTLQTRDTDEYLSVAAEVERRGFASLKCAPFEAVSSPELGLSLSGIGLDILERLRADFPGLGIRVDFHERFRPADFLELLPRFEALGLEWIEEPFAMGEDYRELRSRTGLRIAGGELFWGLETFASIARNEYVHVIMPDVKHVGGFAPLLDVIDATRGQVEVSPHNPSGPISTAASLHAAVLNPDVVRSIEYAFDRDLTRASTGERVDRGRLYLDDAPGWGVAPPG